MNNHSSEISTPSFSFPISEACRLKSFHFQSVFFRNVVVFVREFLETLHDVVFTIVVLSVLRQLLVLQILLLLQHRFWINITHDFFFLEFCRVDIFTDTSFLKNGRFDWLFKINYAIFFYIVATASKKSHLGNVVHFEHIGGWFSKNKHFEVVLLFNLRISILILTNFIINF